MEGSSFARIAVLFGIVILLASGSPLGTGLPNTDQLSRLTMESPGKGSIISDSSNPNAPAWTIWPMWFCLGDYVQNGLAYIKNDNDPSNTPSLELRITGWGFKIPSDAQITRIEVWYVVLII